MKLSIITINYNNASGLRKTLASVAAQTYQNIEHIIVDGGSTDGSVDIIKEYVRNVERMNELKSEGIQVVWSSEPDKGIYNAMNKGIRKATGDYIQILNSGDILAAPDVTERMMAVLSDYDYPDLLYGNAVDLYEGKRFSSHGPGIEYSLRQLFKGTYPHDSSFFRRELFSEDRYGLYDESLKIVSDWKWYLQAIGLGDVKPIYVDVDVSLFDVTGISSKNIELDNEERHNVLKDVLPPAIYADYEQYAFPMSQYKRLKRHHLWGMTHFVERVLFKLEKLHILRK